MAERARNSMYQRPEWDNRLMTHTQPPARPWSLRNALQDAALRGTAMNVAALSELSGGGVPDPRVYAPGAGLLPSPIGDVAGLGQDASMYLRDPESRAFRNYLLTGLGVLPFVPAIASMGKATRNIPTGFGNQIGAVGDYRGLHTAPSPKGGAPLYEVTKDVYPDDIYGPMAAQYYGHGEPFDYESIRVIQSLRGKPDATVTIYRAVPYEPTSSEKLAKLQQQKAKFMARNIVPAEWGGSRKSLGDQQGFYDWVTAEIKRLESEPAPAAEKLSINPGDWVTTSRAYAKQHGESTLLGKYKVLSRKVRAKELFTDGNSIHEWGWVPEGSE